MRLQWDSSGTHLVWINGPHTVSPSTGKFLGETDAPVGLGSASRYSLRLAGKRTLQYAAHRRMLPFLDLEPILRPSGAIERTMPVLLTLIGHTTKC
jgi:hypothetical protein